MTIGFAHGGTGAPMGTYVLSMMSDPLRPKPSSWSAKEAIWTLKPETEPKC